MWRRIPQSVRLDHLVGSIQTFRCIHIIHVPKTDCAKNTLSTVSHSVVFIAYIVNSSNKQLNTDIKYTEWIKQITQLIPRRMKLTGLRTGLLLETGHDVGLQLPQGRGLKGLKVNLYLIGVRVFQRRLSRLDDVHHSAQLVSCSRAEGVRLATTFYFQSTKKAPQWPDLSATQSVGARC